MKTLIAALALLALQNAASANSDSDARKDKLNCALETSSGAKSSVVIPLQYYQDENMSFPAEEDGAEGTAKILGYTVHYVTAAGAVDCPECKTGATKIFYSTLTVSKGKFSDEANGAVFGDAAIENPKVPGVKSVSCVYVADPAAQ